MLWLLDVTATQYLPRLFLEEYWHILIRWCLPVDRRSLWAAFWISYIQASKEQLVHYSFYGGGIDGELSACRQWSVCMDALSMYRLCRDLYISCSDVCITVQNHFTSKVDLEICVHYSNLFFQYLVIDAFRARTFIL